MRHTGPACWERMGRDGHVCRALDAWARPACRRAPATPRPCDRGRITRITRNTRRTAHRGRRRPRLTSRPPLPVLGRTVRLPPAGARRSRRNSGRQEPLALPGRGRSHPRWCRPDPLRWPGGKHVEGPSVRGARPVPCARIASGAAPGAGPAGWRGNGWLPGRCSLRRSTAPCFWSKASSSSLSRNSSATSASASMPTSGSASNAKPSTPWATCSVGRRRPRRLTRRNRRPLTMPSALPSRRVSNSPRVPRSSVAPWRR